MSAASKNFCAFIFFGVMLLFNLSCITHNVMDAYPQYLKNNENTLELNKMSQDFYYSLSPSSSEHIKEVRAISAGYGHKWMLEFKKMLEATLHSTDFNKAFSKVEEKPNNSKGLHTHFDLKNFDFVHHRAEIDLRIVVKKFSKVVLDKVYSATGISQGGKMTFAGAFGMRNAIHQSTKSAMDQILLEFMQDYAKHL